jgi:hypothetical protein
MYLLLYIYCSLNYFPPAEFSTLLMVSFPIGDFGFRGECNPLGCCDSFRPGCPTPVDTGEYGVLSLIGPRRQQSWKNPE